MLALLLMQRNDAGTAAREMPVQAGTMEPPKNSTNHNVVMTAPKDVTNPVMMAKHSANPPNTALDGAGAHAYDGVKG